VIDERTGVAVLRSCFERQGLSIREGVPLSLAPELPHRTIHLDGYDEAARVGFEYLTTEAGDREEVTAEVIAELEARMERGELYVLLIDEREVTSTALLERAAEHFLAVLRARGLLPEVVS
jgi:hypothetical protein